LRTASGTARKPVSSVQKFGHGDDEILGGFGRNKYESRVDPKQSKPRREIHVLLTGISVIFWVAVLWLVYIYLLYPALLYIGALFTEAADGSLDEATLPTVSLVIAAYNEDEIIGEKIENSLRLDYPREKLDVIVFSDASSDNTDAIVESYSDAGVQLNRIEGRVGKTECQNTVVETIDSEIIVFSDADSMYEPQAIRELVSKFAPGVGCVVGELRYKRYGVQAESVYRRYEKLIKRLEPRLSSVVGGNGSIYAVRNDSYVPLPADHISDFAEPLAIVRNGERAEYASNAAAWEDTGDTVNSEADRRVRIVTRAWNTVTDYTSLFNPIGFPVFSIQLASHTVLRWLSPLVLVIAAVANIVLVSTKNSPLYRLLLFLQGSFYLLALGGAIVDESEIPAAGLFRIPYYFLRLNYSLLIGFYNFTSRRNIVVWDTESRTVDGQGTDT
jgi:glycosyltransferase involved in cell wall biosynthesis